MLPHGDHDGALDQNYLATSPDLDTPDVFWQEALVGEVTDDFEQTEEGHRAAIENVYTFDGAHTLSSSSSAKDSDRRSAFRAGLEEEEDESRSYLSRPRQPASLY